MNPVLLYLSWYVSIGSLLATWSWNDHGHQAPVFEGKSTTFKFTCYMMYVFVWPIAAIWEIKRLVKK